MTIDISGSMDDTLHNGYSIIGDVIASACAVAEVLDKLNVKHSLRFVMWSTLATAQCRQGY